MEQKKIEETTKAYRNTEGTGENKSEAEIKKKVSRRQRLKMKIEETRNLYDFKYIKAKLDKPDEDKVYMEPDILDKLIRQPQL